MDINTARPFGVCQVDRGENIEAYAEHGEVLRAVDTRSGYRKSNAIAEAPAFDDQAAPAFGRQGRASWE